MADKKQKAHCFWQMIATKVIGARNRAHERREKKTLPLNPAQSPAVLKVSFKVGWKKEIRFYGFAQKCHFLVGAAHTVIK